MRRYISIALAVVFSLICAPASYATEDKGLESIAGTTSGPSSGSILGGSGGGLGGLLDTFSTAVGASAHFGVDKNGKFQWGLSGWLGFTNSPAGMVGSNGGGAIGDVLCTVVSWFSGTIGQAIATLAVIVLGLGALMGKVSHGQAITVIVGIGVIFGAQGIVYSLTGQQACYGFGGYSVAVAALV